MPFESYGMYHAIYNVGFKELTDIVRGILFKGLKKKSKILEFKRRGNKKN